MIQDDLKWYREIGFPETVISLAEDNISRIERYYGITFEGFYISNKKDESHDEYPSLWLFNNEFVVESKDFLSKTYLDIDLARYKENVKYINIITDNFSSLEEPLVDSKIKLIVSIGNNIKCTFDAVGANCSRLNDLAKMFIREHTKV